MSEAISYLTVAAVKAIHAEVLAAHGGARGLRDETLLESAVAAPQPTMMGVSALPLLQSRLHRWQQTNCAGGVPRISGEQRFAPGGEVTYR